MTPEPLQQPVLHHTLLDPSLSNTQVVEALEMAKRYRPEAVIVRGCDVDLAVRVLQGSSVRVGAIAGYPYGFPNTSVKIYEARDFLRRGAREIGVVIGASKLLSREFQHIQTELNQLSEACRAESATLIVYWDSALLSNELQIIACTCCERAEVDAVAATSLADLPLLKKHLPDETRLQAAATTLDEVLALQEQGVARFATTATAAILDAWKQRNAPPTSA
jgi:deoxyribose-phosphate aldolase